MSPKGFIGAVLLAILIVMPLTVSAAGWPWKGYIVTTAEQPTEFWYVDPLSGWRYQLTTPENFSLLLRTVGKIVNTRDLSAVPVGGSKDAGDPKARQRWAGYFLRDKDHRMAAWYVHPRSKVRTRLTDATSGLVLLQNLAHQLTAEELNAIPRDLGIVRRTLSVATSRGTFTVEDVSFDRTTPGLRILTETAQTNDCRNGCHVHPLAEYVNRRFGQAGIHGTYFCPTDYASCAGQTNSYLYPVFDSLSGVLVNNARVRYTVQPLVVFDTKNTPYYFHDTRTFKSQKTFEATYGVKMRAAISNGPAMVEHGINVLRSDEMDRKQATVKSTRGALAWQGDRVHLLIVRGATVRDSAAVMISLGMDFAVNLDGGGSTALYYAGRYIVGPGRNLPNAIVITSS